VRVLADVEQTEMEGEYGPVDGMCATCRRCGYQTESFGTSEGSINRCLALMREECPEGENNFYVDAEDQPGAGAGG
jgi:hypothetical protein